MFERYTESARRALFFARYEVSELGATAIEPEHVLLGIARQGAGPVTRILSSAQLSLASLHEEIAGGAAFREKIPTSVEIPFSAATKRVMRFAEEEADRLTHHEIGPEHMLLGLLREEGSVAASILTRHNLRLDDVRNTVVKLGTEPGASACEEIDELQQSVRILAARASGSDARGLADQICDGLEALKRYF